jgi:hypothetical protein
LLENLSENLCVSKFSGIHYDQWACYELIVTAPQSKRKTWKPVTGLMPAEAMSHFLLRNYPTEQVSSQFRAIVN